MVFMRAFKLRMRRDVAAFAQAFLFALLAVVGGCGESESGTGAPRTGGAPGADGPALEVVFAYGSEKQSWIDVVTPGFNSQNLKTKSGKTIVVKTVAMGSGESKDDIVAGRLQAHLWSPASGIFVRLANAESQVQGQPLLGATKDLVLSPIVIAMWKPMAESLGWPDKPIGWADVLALARDPQGGWPSRGHPEFGRFKFGHTHPEYSNSGISSVLIEVFAATGKQRDLTLDDLKRPDVASYLAGVERSVVHYGRSTGFFGKRLFEDGPTYLSAAVLYENMVIESYQKNLDPPLVAIYPKEGTIWSDHPVGIVQREWVSDEHREAAQLYIDFLLAAPQQQRALALGFRPAEGAIGAPIDRAHGVDPAEPRTILELPNAAVINAAIDLWRANKKSSTVALVFDRSGSMTEQNRIGAARNGALQLVSLLGPRDRLILVPFSTGVQTIDLGVMDEAGRRKASATISALQPEGKTSLYEAIATAKRAVVSDVLEADGRIAAIVVLTDGEANGGQVSLEQLLEQITVDRETAGIRIFTIGYGKEANAAALQRIAEKSRAEFYKGDQDNIIKVFRDIATFF